MSKNTVALAYGARLRELRKAKKLSQEALADKAGIHRTFVGRVERGEANITLNSILRITKALEVSLSEFFVGFEEQIG